MQSYKIPPAIKDMMVKALKQGGISLVEDLANQLQLEEIELLILGLSRVKEKKKSTIEIKPARSA